MTSLYAATRQRPDTLTLRLEEVETDYDGAARRLLFFLGAATDAADEQQCGHALRLLRAARRHDLSRITRSAMPAHVKAHVSNAADKGALRRLLLQPPEAQRALGGELRALRKQLGYDPETGARGTALAELARRWRLAATATASTQGPVQ